MENKNPRNRIIIIGNGFDLAHGIKTSYRNFIDWLWDKKVKEINDKLEVEEKDFNKKMEGGWQINISKAKDRILMDEDALFVVKEGKTHFDNAIELKNWIVYENGLLETLEKKRTELEDPKWSDIEDVYYDSLLKCNERYNAEKQEKPHGDLSIIKLNREFRVLRAKLLEYLQFAYDSCDKNKPEFIKLIERMKSIFNAKDADEKQIEKILFINFNYTNTLELYIDSDVANANKEEIVYIHGNLEDKNSIIFGYGDELDSNSLNIQENKDNAFLEYNKAVLYARSGEYQRIVPFIYGDNNFEVYIIGHSCANSDRALLNEILDNENCKLIKCVYYSGPPGIEENFKEQICNLYRIFGDNHRNFRKVFCPLIASERIPQILDVENEKKSGSDTYKSSSEEVEILGIQFVKIKIKEGDKKAKMHDFWIGKYPITQLQWKTIMGYNPSNFDGDDLPVEFISYIDCVRFLLSLKSQTGRDFSLPTIEQWRYAAQTHDDSIDSFAWYNNNSNNTTHPVGKKESNDIGVFDMYGNVWEFVINSQNERKDGGVVNACGGSYRSSLAQLKTNSKIEIDQNYRSRDLGVRLVLQTN